MFAKPPAVTANAATAADPLIRAWPKGHGLSVKDPGRVPRTSFACTPERTAEASSLRSAPRTVHGGEP